MIEKIISENTLEFKEFKMLEGGHQFFSFLFLSRIPMARDFIHACVSLCRSLHEKPDSRVFPSHVGKTCFSINLLTTRYGGLRWCRSYDGDSLTRLLTQLLTVVLWSIMTCCIWYITLLHMV